MRDALIRQWRVLAHATRDLDLDGPTRVEGWRNREVVAHLALQPVLLVRFLETASTEPAQLSAWENMAGTAGLASVVDETAQRDARTRTADLGAAVDAAVEPLMTADLSTTVTTIQGSIRLADYLVTRCVEAVVHGGDLVPAVTPDGEALAITAEALTALLESRHPELVGAVERLDALVWIEIATGRRDAPANLATAMPLMA